MLIRPSRAGSTTHFGTNLTYLSSPFLPKEEPEVPMRFDIPPTYIHVAFQFKTREPNGLILYNAGRERDFIAVELVNGHVHYVFDLGDGPVRVRDTSKSKLNDGKWHAVSIGRPASKRHTLAVDDHVTVGNSPGSNENLDLDGILYIGKYRIIE